MPPRRSSTPRSAPPPPPTSPPPRCSTWPTTSTGSPSGEESGNYTATLAALTALQPLPPLVMLGVSMGSVKDSAVLDNTTAAYWASHWELYKHVYAFSK